MLNKFLHQRLLNVPVLHWLVLLLCCVIGYWPVSSNLFSLKNDAFVYFLPCRYMISDAIQNGYAPWWGPYFYQGYPLHGDMQSGAWNPLVLLISVFSRYNMTLLHLETLIYMLIGGIGFHKLLSIRQVSDKSRLVLSACYMFSGFMIDTAQITVWTGSAAFLPFVLLYACRIIQVQGSFIRNGLKGSLALYMLMSAGYPSFLIMACWIIMAGILFRLAYGMYNKRLRINDIGNIGTGLIIMLLAFLLMALPALLSYIDYLPKYQRSAGTSLSEAHENPFNLFGLISYIFPFSVTRYHPWLTTNPTSRSAYIGLFTVVILAGLLRKKWTATDRFIAAGTMIIFLFSLGDALPVRRWFFDYLPGMNLFRHPGTMRIFSITGLLLLAAPLMDQCWRRLQEYDTAFLKKITLACMGLILLFAMLQIKHSALGFTLSSIWQNGFGVETRQTLKSLYDGMTFADAILTDSIIQLSFLGLFYWMLVQKKSATWFIFLFISNMIIPAQLTIPFTMVTRESPDAINQFIKKSPKEYPAPSASRSIASYTEEESNTGRRYASAAVYNKTPAWIDTYVNPSHSNLMKVLDASPAARSAMFVNSFCYLADTLVRYTDSLKLAQGRKGIMFYHPVRSMTKEFAVQSAPTDSAELVSIVPGKVMIHTQTSESRWLCLFQQYMPAWTAEADGKPLSIQNVNLAFTGVKIPAGNHIITFRYEPGYLRYAIMVALTVMAGILLVLYWGRKRY